VTTTTHGPVAQAGAVEVIADGTARSGAGAPASAAVAAPPPTAAMRPALVGLLGTMVALGAITVDLYLPSLPTVAADLGTSAAAVQMTISGVLLGAALGQLLVGPLSDRFGRRRPALVGIAVHVVASLLCVVAPTIEMLIGLRFVQGMGNAAASITAMAVIRDRLTGGPAARVISRLMLVIGVAPLFAPTVGGLIAGAAGWRAVFAVLALLGVGLWLVVWRALPETLPSSRRATGGLGTALRGYRSLIADRRFLGLALIPGLAMGALISYVVGSPFVLQAGYGLSVQQFSLVFALNGLGLVVGAQVNAALVSRHEPLRVVRVALPLALISAAALLAIAVSGVGGVLGILAPLWLILFLLGLITGNAAAIALSRHGERAGTAAAVIGATQAGVAGAVSPLVGVLGGDATAMALAILGSVLAATAVLALTTPAYRRQGA
jgi:DHA1 family bicyclomycin/chloramphenicol resistance-like MFS transporter